LTSAVTARKTAEESAAVTKALANKSSTTETRIATYEGRLLELETKCAAQLMTIEALLPGATSAGLAHAFNERRLTFLNRKTGAWLFVGSVLALVVLAFSGLWHVYKDANQIARQSLMISERAYIKISHTPPGLRLVDAPQGTYEVTLVV
jgi:hypothetical protein